MIRSKFATPDSRLACRAVARSLPSRAEAGGSWLVARDCRLLTALPAIFPRNDQAEADMKAAETRGHERVAPCGRRDEGRDAQRHEEEAHDGHDAHRQCSAGGDGRAVEQ